MDPLGQSGLMMSKRLFLILATLALGSLRVANCQPTWPYETQVGAFQIHADFPLQTHQRDFAQLSLLHSDVSSILGLEPPSKETHIYLFRRKSTYRKYLNRYFPGVSQRRAMFIQQSDIGMVFAYRGRHMMTDLRHECTHAILHSSLPVVPLWLDEGLAEYFEVPRQDRHANNPHLFSLRRKVQSDDMSSITELERLDDFSKMMSHHYRDAWAWVHFMLHGPNSARQALRSYIHDIQQRVPPGEFSERLTVAVPNSEVEFRRHFFPQHGIPLLSQKEKR